MTVRENVLCHCERSAAISAEELDTMRWSIIICTHNRASDLQKTLPKLAELDYAADEFEVIVVDNASIDNTPEVVNRAQDTITNLRSAREERVGLSHARNKGIAVARGEFIAFIDDDAWPDKDWLKKLEEVFEDPGVACAGGMVKPSWQKLRGWPQWLHERHIGFFTVIEYRDYRELHYPDYPAGTNVAFRRKIFNELGSFNTSLGRAGDCLLSGEETDLCLRLEQAGYTIKYTPDAVVHHNIHEDRLNKDWLIQRSHWQGASIAVIENEHFNKSKIVIRTMKYLIVIVAGELGNVFFSCMRDERMAFFCACQVTLCKAYITKAWGKR